MFSPDFDALRSRVCYCDFQQQLREYENANANATFHYHPGVSGPDNDRTIFPMSLCGPKISGPHNDWSIGTLNMTFEIENVNINIEFFVCIL